MHQSVHASASTKNMFKKYLNINSNNMPMPQMNLINRQKKEEKEVFKSLEYDSDEDGGITNNINESPIFFNN